MSDKFAALPISVRVGLGAIAWGLILLFAWAIHPVDATARFGPIDDPTPAQQASIDRVMGDSDDPDRDFVVTFECTSTPLQAATGTASPLAVPSLEEGFEYVEFPCTRAYESARAALWVNASAIGAVLAGCVALQVHQMRRRRDAAEAPADEQSPEPAQV